jgi:hypothetical protein
MTLEAYLSRTYDIVFSRRGLTIDVFEVLRFPARRAATIEARVRYWDDSLHRFYEELVEEGFRLRKLEYVYHYQQPDATLVFRYDNAPHYPSISTFPHHKHVGYGAEERVQPSQAPQLADILKEIELRLNASE